MNTTEYGYNVNQPGFSEYPRFTITNESLTKQAIIEDVILNERHPLYATDGSNIGLAQVRYIPDDAGVTNDGAGLNWALPMDSSVKEFPLLNEVVLVHVITGRLFYSRRLNVTNKLAQCAWPALAVGSNTEISSANRSQNAVMAAQGGDTYTPQTNEPIKQLGDSFIENPNVQPVRSCEGDSVIYGRYGNLIRLGSSLWSNPDTQNPQPNILIVAGQTPVAESSTGKTITPYSLVYEDVNENISSIWMVSDEEVRFRSATQNSQATNKANLRSSEITRLDPHYTGAQIFINSDRLILNSKQNEISLFSKSEINLSSIGSITLDSERSVYLTSNVDIILDSMDDILLTGKTISLSARENLSHKTSGNYSILGKKIFIGTANDVSEPMVLGASLSSFLQKLIDIFTTNLPTATAVITTAPGIAPVQFVSLIAALKALQLTQLGITPQSAVFNSTDNFVTKRNQQ